MTARVTIAVDGAPVRAAEGIFATPDACAKAGVDLTFAGIFRAPKASAITLPTSKEDRYRSAMIPQADHAIDRVFSGHGSFEIASGAEFVYVAIRVQVDAADPPTWLDWTSCGTGSSRCPTAARQGTMTCAPATAQASGHGYEQDWQEAAAMPDLNAPLGARGRHDRPAEAAPLRHCGDWSASARDRRLYVP